MVATVNKEMFNARRMGVDVLVPIGYIHIATQEVVRGMIRLYLVKRIKYNEHIMS